MSKLHVYIIHGYQAVPEDHWFAWLEQQIRQSGGTVERVFLADSAHPDTEVWQTCLSAQCTHLNEHTVMVAHGLGCLASLSFLSQALEKTSIAAGIFVAGFIGKLPTLPELDQFIQENTINRSLLCRNIQRRYMLFSTNDPFVPPPLSLQLGHALKAQSIEIKKAGHFMQQDGYDMFPKLWEIIQPLLLNPVPHSVASL